MTGYLLDTNIVSETRKRHGNPGALDFLTRANSSSLFISVLTLGELRKGAALKRRKDSDAADALTAWIDGLEFGFADRVLPVDVRVARVWGELSAERSRPVTDTLLAATAMVHELTFVTRNVADIEDLELKVLNPFSV